MLHGQESRAVIVSQRLAEREMASGEVVEYIGWVQARFGGVWVCGLCEEAIKDERARLGVVGVEVALRVHATFRETADASPPIPEAQSIVQLIKKIMSTSSSPN